jgi:hypothetical protein
MGDMLTRSSRVDGNITMSDWRTAVHLSRGSDSADCHTESRMMKLRWKNVHKSQMSKCYCESISFASIFSEQLFTCRPVSATQRFFLFPNIDIKHLALVLYLHCLGSQEWAHFPISSKKIISRKTKQDGTDHCFVTIPPISWNKKLTEFRSESFRGVGEWKGGLSRRGRAEGWSRSRRGLSLRSRYGFEGC